MGISLEKRVEAVGIQLAKRGITTVPPTRVGLALDVSGSTLGLYQRGVMQETVDRVQAVALKFDDNGELDMWYFDDGYGQLATAKAADYNNYVKRAIMKNRSIAWGGTQYGPVLNAMINFWFPSANAQPVQEKSGGLFGGLFGKKSTPSPTQTAPASASLPAMGLLITDGANSDRGYAAQVLKEAARHNVYWNMVGVGPGSNFSFLQEQASKLDNVGFVNLSSLQMSDEELYQQIISTEFCEWIKKRTP